MIVMITSYISWSGVRAPLFAYIELFLVFSFSTVKFPSLTLSGAEKAYFVQDLRKREASTIAKLRHCSSQIKPHRTNIETHKRVVAPNTLHCDLYIFAWSTYTSCTIAPQRIKPFATESLDVREHTSYRICRKIIERTNTYESLSAVNKPFCREVTFLTPPFITLHTP